MLADGPPPTTAGGLLPATSTSSAGMPAKRDTGGPAGTAGEAAAEDKGGSDELEVADVGGGEAGCSASGGDAGGRGWAGGSCAEADRWCKPPPAACRLCRAWAAR